MNIKIAITILILGFVAGCELPAPPPAVASKADCDKLGEWTADVMAKEAKERGVPAELVGGDAVDRLVARCKEDKWSKARFECLMKSWSLADMGKCE